MAEVFDVAVIGAGPAGLAAAGAAAGAGAEVVVLDREARPGGILQQCIHPGFGLLDYQEDLTGPEYARRRIDDLERAGVPVRTEHMVLRLEPAARGYSVVAAHRRGLVRLETRALVLAMGCRERTRGQLRIPGTRPAGIFTAGTAQRWINIEGYQVGRRVIILGSGDIGLIMARRLTLEGGQVPVVVEILPYESGLKRNVVQCLEDYSIPLLLGHTVTEVHGYQRVEGVTVCEVDADLAPREDTARYWPCDTLLLSVGLIPENELSRGLGVEMDPRTRGPLVDQWGETGLTGVFSCGNVLHVNDLVDRAAQEGIKSGLRAAELAASPAVTGSGHGVRVLPGSHVQYVVPQRLRVPTADAITVSLRVTHPMARARLLVRQGERECLRLLLRWVRPGEMVVFELPGDQLQDEEDVIIHVAEE